jgi:NAD(P)-dependent dehydrogenase (short-subunit alcohol dehydrogenase family)
MSITSAIKSTKGADMPVAIITGGSRGLGRALAAGLADDGWDLVLDARGAAELDAAVSEVSTTVIAVAGDITDPRHRADLITAADKLGGADLLINNASTLGPSPLPRLADYPVDALREVFEVNTVAVLAITQLALPGLRERSGAIVNITSDAAIEPYEGWGGYGASKAAVEQISNVLAIEEPTVRVWWTDPGDLRTRMHQDAYPGEDISDRPLPETVVPAMLTLIADRPDSGRYRLPELT